MDYEVLIKIEHNVSIVQAPSFCFRVPREARGCRPPTRMARRPKDGERERESEVQPAAQCDGDPHNRATRTRDRPRETTHLIPVLFLRTTIDIFSVMVDFAVSKMFCESWPLEYFTGRSTHASSDARRTKPCAHKFSPHTLHCAWPCPGCQSRQMQRETPRNRNNCPAYDANGEHWM